MAEYRQKMTLLEPAPNPGNNSQSQDPNRQLCSLQEDYGLEDMLPSAVSTSEEMSIDEEFEAYAFSKDLGNVEPLKFWAVSQHLCFNIYTS